MKDTMSIKYLAYKQLKPKQKERFKKVIILLGHKVCTQPGNITHCDLFDRVHNLVSDPNR